MLRKILQHRRVTNHYPEKAIDTRLFACKPVVDTSKCVGCKACVAACDVGAVCWDKPKDEDKQTIGFNYDLCLFCERCADACQHGALVMSHDFELAEADRMDLRHVPYPKGDGPQGRMDHMENQLEHLEALGEAVRKKIHKKFGRSLQIREVDSGSCNGCDYEINALNNPFNDLERFGIHFVASPRHADMLLVTGTASRNMENALIKTYNATPDPKLVVAVGACACSGGIFRDSYATRNGIDQVVPVDLYIPGCPPRPQALLYGILKAINRI